MAEGSGPRRGAELLSRLVTGSAGDEGCLTHVEQLHARAGVPAEWPLWTPELLRQRLALAGVDAPWTHQVAAAELAWAGESVVVATGTASGKSLCYQLPVLSTLLADDRATALYLAPTKALGNGQLRAVRDLMLTDVRAATLDGDTAAEERDWVRAHSRWVFTNPDLLHRTLLPGHARWASMLRRLRYVVVDECHTYRGVFGSHVGLVLRRLLRVCARYGSTPTFVLASATQRDPDLAAQRLCGVPVRAVTVDGSPRGRTTFALWEPPLTTLVGENGAPVRRSTGAETARLLADLVVDGARTLAFVRSRRGAEAVARQTRRLLAEAGATELVPRVAAYRAGYLPEERRALEADLSSGRLLGVAVTNALELGIDISGLDAVVLAGFPGTLASLWQQAGRAGRRGADALVVFVARDDPLDTYLVHHPESVFGRPVETTVTHPGNPYVLGPQLCCAAAELPVTESELELLGGDAARSTLADLVAAGSLRRRSGGWYWTSRTRPGADIRGSGGEQIAIVEVSTGRLLGTVAAGAADSALHAGAVYLHQGASFVCDDLDLTRSVALVHAEEPAWTTNSREITDIAVADVSLREQVGADLQVCFGTVEVSRQVVSYQRRRVGSGAVIDEVPLDLPMRQLSTRAVWYEASPALLADAGIDERGAPGALHAAEHAAIGLLPLLATCDRWDLGGVSTAHHPDTGAATVFVYDGYPGGAGFAEHGYGHLTEWLTATREAVRACECPAGCPSCVQSPKCGNGNEPLDKAGAVRLLGAALEALAGRRP